MTGPTDPGDGRVPLICCAGVAVLDQIFRVERFPEPGSKVPASDYLAVGGGCAANASVAVARLGARARIVAPLGGPAGVDPVGDTIIAGLRRERVDCAGIARVDGVNSPVATIMLDAAGERMVATRRSRDLATARLGDPAALLADAAVLLTDNRFTEFVLPLARAARERGIPLVIDADGGTDPADPLLGLATHAVFAADALRATTGMSDLASSLRWLAQRSDAFLAVTDSERGVRWIDGDEIRHLPAFAVATVDTLAAGDVFHGAFALALAEARPIADALRFASAAAAIKCTRFGGISGAPDRSEVLAFLADRA
jgi:sulfofructose kinase